MSTPKQYTDEELAGLLKSAHTHFWCSHNFWVAGDQDECWREMAKKARELLSDDNFATKQCCDRHCEIFSEVRKLWEAVYILRRDMQSNREQR